MLVDVQRSIRAHRVLAIALAFGAATLGTGCSNLLSDLTSPTSSSSSSSSGESNTVTGTLAVQGTNVFTFTVTNAGTVSVTLTTLSAPVAVGLGIGTPNGTACNLTSTSATVVAGSTAQISATENPGTYCASIYDVGNLTSAATFSLTITHS